MPLNEGGNELPFYITHTGNLFGKRVFILPDSSQYELGREFAAVSTGDGHSSAPDRHVVLSGSISGTLSAMAPLSDTEC